MKVVLIPCGPTEWHDEGRLLGRVEVPLTAQGEQRCDQWRAALAAQSIRKIFHSPDDLASRTAGLIGNPLGIPTKPLEELSEVDVGLWAGLTEKEMKTRYASAHRELCEAPRSVRSPGAPGLRTRRHDPAAARPWIESRIRTSIPPTERGDGRAVCTCGRARGELPDDLVVGRRTPARSDTPLGDWDRQPMCEPLQARCCFRLSRPGTHPWRSRRRREPLVALGAACAPGRTRSRSIASDLRCGARCARSGVADEPTRARQGVCRG